MLYPVQRTLLVPRDMLSLGAEYLADVNRLRAENAELRRLEAANANALLQTRQLAAENQQLRQLLAMRDRTAIRSTVAEVLYDTRDAFSRKLVLDKGKQHGVIAGQPVIDAGGVAGQITRVFPLSSEVRAGHRSTIDDAGRDPPHRRALSRVRRIARDDRVALPAHQRRRPRGDLLVTSGLDGLFRRAAGGHGQQGRNRLLGIRARHAAGARQAHQAAADPAGRAWSQPAPPPAEEPAIESRGRRRGS